MSLFVDGALFRTLEEALEPTERAPVPEDVSEGSPDADTSMGHEDTHDTPAVVSRDEGGCGASSSPSEGALPLQIGAALTFMLLPRRRS